MLRQRLKHIKKLVRVPVFQPSPKIKQWLLKISLQNRLFIFIFGCVNYFVKCRWDDCLSSSETNDGKSDRKSP